MFGIMSEMSVIKMSPSMRMSSALFTVFRTRSVVKVQIKFLSMMTFTMAKMEALTRLHTILWFKHHFSRCQDGYLEVTDGIEVTIF
jgi:hypothetical protein